MMKILLPVDGSALSLRAVQAAMGLCHQGLKASVLLLNVQDPATLYEMVVAPDPEALSQQAGADTLAPAETLLAQAGVDWESEVVTGDPAHMILEAVERHGCGLVVLGSHGTGDLRGALLGSVSHEVVQAASVAVMVVREDSRLPHEAEASAQQVDDEDMAT